MPWVTPAGPVEGCSLCGLAPVVQVKAASLGDLTSGQKRRQLFRAGCLCKETHWKACLEQRVWGLSEGAGLASEETATAAPIAAPAPDGQPHR